MKKTVCNPLDLGYHYQHFRYPDHRYSLREGADPTLVYYKGRYYLYVSVSAGFWHSADLVEWEYQRLPDFAVNYYAPDVRQVGDDLILSASGNEKDRLICKTDDPLSGTYTKFDAPFPYGDPDLFQDDDGRVYLYWGSSNQTPTYGVEMDPETMLPIGEKKELIVAHEDVNGYERFGRPDLRPWVEGSFMTKHDGKYYLQIAVPGTEFATYSDAVYVSDSPLGPFSMQDSQPFSSKPGGFITGAGHGSTIADVYGNYFHTATMRISCNHLFERRVGLFPAGFDEKGRMYCQQNFADYPFRIPTKKEDPRRIAPEWMLLSYGKPASASSTAKGSDPSLAFDEEIRTWWSAGSDTPGEWLCVDLGKNADIRAIQVNFADEGFSPVFDDPLYDADDGHRYIDRAEPQTRFTLAVSEDGIVWRELEQVSRCCSHPYFEYEDGIRARYVRVIGWEMPYGQVMRISGLRVFGNGEGRAPLQAEIVSAVRDANGMDARIAWKPIEGAQGCNIRYGVSPDALYQSMIVYGKNELLLPMLIKGKDYTICVDSFNESGVTEGKPFQLRG